MSGRTRSLGLLALLSVSACEPLFVEPGRATNRAVAVAFQAGGLAAAAQEQFDQLDAASITISQDEATLFTGIVELTAVPEGWAADVGLDVAAVEGSVDIEAQLISGGETVFVGESSFTVGPGAAGQATVPVRAVVRFVQVGNGGRFSCALADTGAAYCWGQNTLGMLGNGTTDPSQVPVPVSGGYVFQSIAVGDRVACGLTASGEAYCWGNNIRGMLGSGDAGLQFSAVPLLVAGGLSFDRVDVGLLVACGDADGAVYCWGSNVSGALGDGNVGVDAASPVEVVGSRSLGLSSVDAGAGTTCALDAASTLFCWGRRTVFGDTLVAAGNALSPEVAAGGLMLSQVEVANLHVCGLDPAGVAYCWGPRNAAGAQGNGTEDGGLVPTPVLGGLTFESLDINDNNIINGPTCGITISGDVWCWGSSRNGEFGPAFADTCDAGTSFPFDCALQPVLVEAGSNFESISVGNDHVCALGSDQRVYCWGADDEGQLGNGILGASPTPTPVRNP